LASPETSVLFGTVGPYELLEKIAQGGMGVVFKARHTTLGRIVALKTLRGEAESPAFQARFDQETRAAARLNHPHIVPIYDVGMHQGRPWYTMALLTGGNLAEHRGRYFDDSRAVLLLMERTARAVQYAHEQGVLHRDLKPSNVLLDESGEPHVSDFGLAKLRDADVELTQTGTVLGTPAYMAPEQADGRTRQIGPGTDVWALGVILYELLTGRRPFVGENSEEVKRHIREEQPPRPRKLRRSLSRDVEAVLLTCLEKDPARRYASAGALADDLARCLRGEPVRPTGRLVGVWRSMRRHPVVCALLVMTAVMAVLLPVARHLTDPDRPWKDDQRALARGQPVTLIRDTGMPRWSRWVVGQGAFQQSSADATSYVHGVNLNLLELLPGPLPDRYTFRAEVRHLDDRGGTVGLYFARRRHSPQEAEEDNYLTLTFSDFGPSMAVKRNEALPYFAAGTLGLLAFLRGHGPLLAAASLFPGKELPAKRTTLGVARWTKALGQHTVATSGKKYPVSSDLSWRVLAVTVTPEAVEAFWNTERIGRLPRARMMKLSKMAFHANAGFDPKWDFGPTGGLGLYVESGGASFRRVVVEPFE
jgi:serine/threonine-protein kinase